MLIVYFTSKTKNTERFISKIDLDINSIKISKDLIVNEKFILFCPTYADTNGSGSVPPQVIKFLSVKENRDNMIGVVGFGNANFGKYFAISADVISYKCGVPVIGKVELFGTPYEVEEVKKRLKAYNEQQSEIY